MHAIINTSPVSGESMAESLRGVYELDKDAALQFKGELLEVMAKYEKAVGMK